MLRGVIMLCLCRENLLITQLSQMISLNKLISGK